MHSSIRERNPDFAGAVLELIQLPYRAAKTAGLGSTQRQVMVYTVEGSSAYLFEEIDRMPTQTLRIWDEVCAEAVAETRRRAGGKGTLI